MESGGLPSCLESDEEEAGDRIPNLSGTDWPRGPYLAMRDIPLASKDCGNGALRAVLRLSTGDFGYWYSLGGEPNCDVGGELSPESRAEWFWY